MRLSQGRAASGKVPQLKAPGIRSKNITVIAAMTTLGILHYSILDGNGNRERFLHFVDDLAHHRDAAALPNDSILIMDNCTIHHGAQVQEVLEIRGFSWRYLTPYSPFFNPIENMFSMWKHYVRASKCETEEELFVAIHAAANRITAEQCANMITHTSSNVLKCTQGERLLI